MENDSYCVDKIWGRISTIMTIPEYSEETLVKWLLLQNRSYSISKDFAGRIFIEKDVVENTVKFGIILLNSEKKVFNLAPWFEPKFGYFWNKYGYLQSIFIVFQ